MKYFVQFEYNTEKHWSKESLRQFIMKQMEQDDGEVICLDIHERGKSDV